MKGHDKAPLTGSEIRKALRQPIGTPRLSELAKGKRQVCILFDDIPKPTQPGDVIPFVIEELHLGGITDSQIRFLCAPGTHRYLTQPEFEAKLGRDVVQRYPVYNHSVWENLVHVGNTSRGTPVHVNGGYHACDLRLGIGSIFPHGIAGFGGGGKIILPGICGLDTIEYHHRNILKNAEFVRVDDNEFRLDIEEAARLSGLHFKVDMVINNHRQAIGLFAGDLVEEHRAAVEMARREYATTMPNNVDILVANSYPDESQMVRSMWPVPRCLKKHGDVVFLTHSFEGQNLLQLSSQFGTDYGGRMYDPKRSYPGFDVADRVIVMTPSLSKYDRDDLRPKEKVIWCKNWGEVLAELVGIHGKGTKVAVFPYAPLQIPA
jgi:nickel-dependent lactate racemase